MRNVTVAEPDNPPLDLSKYKLKSLTDDSWCMQYISKMSEEGFLKYKRLVYEKLSEIAVGEHILVTRWCIPENFDLFIKIACCFISESECCYQFNSTHTIIKHQFDKNETLDNRPKKICMESYQRKTASANS